MEFKRCSGILMPISSLPGGYGIGSMGKPARDFVDFLTKAGQTIWQILPVGPTGYADSPYQSCSAFAGNPYFIDLDLLAADGLLTKKDYANINWGGDAAKVDYGTLYEKRFTVLRKAYHNFMRQRPVPGYDTPYPDDWYRFQFLSSDWLPDYCLYMAIKEDNGMVDWQQWPRALRVREPEAMARFRAEHAEEIEFWAFLQYEFDRQWRSLHAYAKSKGIAIMGDIPIYVAADSADAWAGRELFETDAEGKPRRVAGCPPDYFAADGQLWGNPLYDWNYHRSTGYAWWIRRIRHALSIYDILRIDHFRGFDTYWAIPAGETTARNGRWEQGPRMDLFRALHNALGSLPIVAEDLGEMFDSVRQLLAESGFPGMKVLQFAFTGEDSVDSAPQLPAQLRGLPRHPRQQHPLRLVRRGTDPCPAQAGGGILRPDQAGGHCARYAARRAGQHGGAGDYPDGRLAGGTRCQPYEHPRHGPGQLAVARRRQKADPRAGKGNAHHGGAVLPSYR